MITIKNLRDEDGFFYPRTHMKAVINNDGTNVQNLINSIDEDINQFLIKTDVITSTGNGSLYLSNDGTYKELPPIDTDEHLYITVTSNQPQPDTSLYDTKIIVTDTTEGTSETFTWNGAKIHKKIPYSHVYTVTTTAVEGYSTPEVKTFTAVLQGSNEVEISSNTCVLSFTSPVFAEVTIGYDNVTRLTNSSNIIKVPYGKTVIVTPHAVEGYTAPSAFTVVANADSKTVTLNYIQSQLKVNILSNQGEDETIDVVEATVTYGSTSVKVTNGQIVAIPSDTTIHISFPEIEGYKKPDDIVFTHNGGLVEKSGTYKCELLTVNVSADSGTPTGFEVTINKQETVGVATKYTRLEYIESNGSQYIDTGFVPNQDTRVVMDIDPTVVSTHAWAFGARQFTEQNRYDFLWQNDMKSWIFSFNGSGYAKLGEGLVSNTDRLNIDFNKNTCLVNGYSATLANGTVSPNVNLTLLACNTNGTISGFISAYLYSCKIYDNGTLVRDYIPALRPDGIAGLYDAVNDTFVASSGSGNFVAGAFEPTIVAKQTSVTGSYKIPFDASYTVQASSVSGYTTPLSVTRIANSVSYTIEQKYEVIKVKDLSLFDVYGNPIQRSTANCYVIREVGQYKFPLVYGNAIKNGTVNTAAFTNNGGTYSHDFINSYGGKITSPYVEYSNYYNSIRVENIDEEDCVSDVYLAEENGVYFCYLAVTNIPSTGANAIIKYQSGEMGGWSWHIWLWPHDLSPVEITNSTGVKYNIMPVNLASKYDSDGVHIKNWFYQWGRPMPLLCPSAWNSTTDHTPGSITKASKASSLDEGIVFPTTFYYNSASPYNWFGTKSYYNLWDAACTETGASDNDTVKTVYDPCPVGWKVPNGNTFTGLSILSSANGIVKMRRYSGDNVGVGFPLSGLRRNSDGSLNDVGSGGYYWLSSAHSQNYVHYLYLNSNHVNLQDIADRAAGFSVRPVQDT